MTMILDTAASDSVLTLVYAFPASQLGVPSFSFKYFAWDFSILSYFLWIFNLVALVNSNSSIILNWSLTVCIYYSHVPCWFPFHVYSEPASFFTHSLQIIWILVFVSVMPRIHFQFSGHDQIWLKGTRDSRQIREINRCTRQISLVNTALPQKSLGIYIQLEKSERLGIQKQGTNTWKEKREKAGQYV